MPRIMIEECDGGFHYVRHSNHPDEWFWRMLLCRFTDQNFEPVVISAYEEAVRQYESLEVYCAPTDPGIYSVNAQDLWFVSSKVIEVGWRKYVEATLLKEETLKRVEERLLFKQTHGMAPEEYFCRCGAEPMKSKIMVQLNDPMNGRFDQYRSFCSKCWRKHLRLERRLLDVKETRSLIRSVKRTLKEKSNEQD